MTFCPNCGYNNAFNSIKHCLNCGAKLPATKMYCPDCHKIYTNYENFCIDCGSVLVDKKRYELSLEIKKIDEELENLSIKNNSRISNVQTRHIYEEGVSLDFPDYYLLAGIPDNVPDCVIALAKNDGACDVMIEVSRDLNRIIFDSNFENTYKQYIESLGYYDMRTIYGFGPKRACFQSYLNHELGVIKQTVYFDFRFERDIRITFNTLKSVNYDCMDDLKIISNNLKYSTPR